MLKKLRYFCTLLLMAVASVAWAQTTYTKVTEAPDDWSGTYVIVADDNNVIFTGQNGSSTNGGYASVTISNGSVTGNYADYEVLVEKSGNYYTMQHISSGKYLGWNTGNNLHFSTDEPATNAFKWTLSTSSILNANDSQRKLQYNSSSPRFACYTSNQKVAYLYLKESGSSTAVATTTTIDNSGITNTDVYVSTEAGSLSATVTETESGNEVSGATVTWTSSKESVATVDENGVVTLVAAGKTTITATYAGVSGEFVGSSATYELTVTSSAPYEQPTTVEINMNYEWLGSNNGQNLSADQLPVVNVDDNVTTTITDGTSTRPRGDADYIRIYKGSTLTFEAPEGYAITSIEFTTGGNNTWNAPDVSPGSLDNKTWTGNAESVVFTLSGSCFISKATITLGAPSTEPIIEANDVEIEYNAEVGVIDFSIKNFVEGGSITASCESDWLLVDDEAQYDNEGTFNLLCDQNPTTTERTATVTLTYSYGESEVTKDVIVTQAAAPVVYTTIPEIFDAATSTATDVVVEFDDWVVSGVSTNGKNVFVTDNSGNGFVIYSSSDQSSTYKVGNILYGTVNCSLKLNQGYAQLTNVNADDLLIDDGGSVDVVNIEMADLAGVNTGALVSYENLTCSVDNNKYYLTDGTTTVQIYNSLYADAYSTLEDGKVYNITGIYQQYGSTEEILPRSADDIEEVASTVKLTIRENFTATTFSCDKALDFTNVEGITAYIITDDKGSTTKVTEVPANTGLYIEGAAGDYEIPIIANADEISGNLLEATDGSTTLYSDNNTVYYAFGKQNGKEAFYKVPASGYTPSANKAVLVVNAPASSAKEMIVIGGDVTGIESIENGTIVNDNYYTIDGKLVKGQPTQKGIYVVNGRKVVIK